MKNKIGVKSQVNKERQIDIYTSTYTVNIILNEKIPKMNGKT